MNYNIIGPTAVCIQRKQKLSELLLMTFILDYNDYINQDIVA